jgi:hypothetical protein
MKNSRKLHTLIAALSLVAVFSPDVSTFASWLGTFEGGWVKYAVKGVGWLGAFLSAWPVIRGKVTPIVEAVETDPTTPKP